ncbi:hypothetical protein N752_28205 [Desulforamulus aquiferis]|nr:hypothetical protein N752_28205 [Desulforamulus aquiferis]
MLPGLLPESSRKELNPKATEVRSPYTLAAIGCSQPLAPKARPKAFAA